MGKIAVTLGTLATAGVFTLGVMTGKFYERALHIDPKRRQAAEAGRKYVAENKVDLAMVSWNKWTTQKYREITSEPPSRFGGYRLVGRDTNFDGDLDEVKKTYRLGPLGISFTYTQAEREGLEKKFDELNVK